MNDLNDLYYFAKIVEHGSLSAAATVVGVAKSVVSQHLARLEAELGVRLIQRSTRRLQITDVGKRYYQRCRAMVAEFESARQVIDNVRGVPRGRVRVSCTLNFAQIFAARAIAAFMAEYPEFEVTLDVSNKDIDVLADGYDLVLRVAPSIKSSNLIVRSFAIGRHCMVASPTLIARCGEPQHPGDLAALPSVGGTFPVEHGASHLWRLVGPNGQRRRIAYRPRLVSEDLFALKEAVLAGCGIADLPPLLCSDEIADGRLIRLLKKWQLPDVHVYAIYPSRQGLPLTVRMLLDYLMANLRPFIGSLRSYGLQIKGGAMEKGALDRAVRTSGVARKTAIAHRA